MQDNNIEGLGEKRALLVMTFLEIKSCTQKCQSQNQHFNIDSYQYWSFQKKNEKWMTWPPEALFALL